MPTLRFLVSDRFEPSIIEMLRNRKSWIWAWSPIPSENLFDLHGTPLSARSFLLIIRQRAGPFDCAILAKGATSLPFLRFSGNLFIGRQIESQLRRLGMPCPTILNAPTVIS